jgi:Bacteriocin-protection, YdeI or OmpD-Associated
VSEKTVAQKMLMKAGHRVLTVNAPRFYPTLMGGLPEGVRVVKSGEVELVHLFVKDRVELDRHLASAFEAVGAETMLWISFPKLTSGLATDISRDEGWGPVHAAGWEPVTIVSVDDTWSALRFKRSADIPARVARVGQAGGNPQTPVAVETTVAEPPAKVERGGEVTVPEDFAAALAAAPRARAQFDAMKLSHRREYIDSIEEAKRPETRARRIAAMVDKIVADAARKG